MRLTRFWAIAFTFLWLELLARWCLAAGIQACFDGASVSPDTATVRLLGGTTTVGELPVAPASGRVCLTYPFPPAFPRGVNTPMTVVGVNSLGEVGPASNAVTFRAPNLPPLLANPTVAGVAGP